MRTILLALVILFIACEPPDEYKHLKPYILSEEKFMDVFVDYTLIESTINLNIKGANDQNFDSLYNFNVFKKHNVSKAQYDSTLKYYSAKPEEFKEIMERVLERMNMQKPK